MTDLVRRRWEPCEIEVNTAEPYLRRSFRLGLQAAVGKTGLIFQNTLFDENATCHIAYGNGLPMAVADTDGLTTDELLAMGVNVSSVHTDFMIGSPDVDIWGLDREGAETPIITSGDWVLPTV